MNLLQCFLSEHDCFKTGRTIAPKGVMVHSTGANNPNLRRYVQPAKTDPDYARLRSLLGKNSNGNHWNRPGLNACVHAFIGKRADGEVEAVQTLPWICRGWHAGKGSGRASANNTHIAFEICEDGLEDPDYFDRAYRKAVELTAYLCTQFCLDPLEPGVVICHSEGHRLGVASNHGDVEHWFPRMGKSMDEFRADTADVIRRWEEDDMTQEQFDAQMEQWLARRAAEPASDWSAGARAWMEEMGLLRGDGQGDRQYRAFCTREELAMVIYRLEHPEE